MQKSMIFHLTEEDIEDAKRYGLNNVLLYLTSNRTGTLWRMGHDGVAVEIMPPYRTLRFYQEEEGEWRLYPLTDHFAPCALRAEIQQLDPFDIAPQSEALVQSLPEMKAPKEGLVQLAYQFFEARARGGKVSSFPDGVSLTNGFPATHSAINAASQTSRA